MNDYPYGCNYHLVDDCGCPGYPSLQEILRGCGKDCIDWQRSERCLRCQAADMIDLYKTRSERYLERIIELQETIEELSPPTGYISTELPTEGLNVSTRSSSETPPPRDPPADPGRWSERGRDGRRRTRRSLPKVEPRMPDAIVTEDGSPMSSSDTDLLEMLEIAAGRRDGWEYRPFKDHEGGLYGDALDEIERLRRWKTEATVALEEVQSEWEAAGKPGVLGQSHVRGMATQIEMLRDESTYWQDCYRASNYAHAELRDLIIEWADAEEGYFDIGTEEGQRKVDRLDAAEDALRKAVGR